MGCRLQKVQEVGQRYVGKVREGAAKWALEWVCALHSACLS